MMTIKVTYPDGATELIAQAIRVDHTKLSRGMYDFYDRRGNLLRQIGMGEGITWEEVDDAEPDLKRESEMGRLSGSVLLLSLLLPLLPAVAVSALPGRRETS